MTIATALMILTSVAARVVPTSAPAAPHDTERAHRVMYVSPVATPRAVRSVPDVRVRARVSPRTRPSAPPREPVPVPQPDRVAPDSSAGAQVSPNAARSAVSEFERSWTAHGVSPLLLPSTPAAPGSAGGAPSRGPMLRMPNTPIDRDAQIRAQEMADRAAQAAGAPMSPSAQRGISIPAPIPFGGPSNAQRKRDSTINAQTKAVLVRVRQRLDSIAAARRRHADSVAAVEKGP
ncbi:MAG TPA: hypothetical protein VGR59_02455 [Gemmatimonadaceae bacterium]|nr:hypothetical protein [Gemmatimonadaceae bacterium]